MSKILRNPIAIAQLWRCAVLGFAAWLATSGAAMADGPLLVVFADGSRVEGTKLEGWFDPDGKATEIKLDGKNLIDPAKPIRFLRDNDLPIKAPTAWLEMTGGDILPGRIEGVEPGGFDGERPRVMVSLESPLFAPGAGRGYLPVRSERVARR